VCSLVYWILLHGDDEDDKVDLTNILMHMTNSLVLLFDVLVIQHEYRFLHFLHPIFCGTLYVAFSIIYPFLGGVNDKGHNYIYSVLNWKEKPLNAAIVAIGVYTILFVLHVIICRIAKVKQMVHDSLLGDRSFNTLRNNELLSIESEIKE